MDYRFNAGLEKENTANTFALNITGATAGRPERWSIFARLPSVTSRAVMTWRRLISIKIHALAKGEQIIAVPTLVKQLPAPLRRFIGELSDTQRIIFGMDLKAP